MALVVSTISGGGQVHINPRKSLSSSSSFRAERRSWMLKDYLRDDMSSCSSNGFRSFPRKQCCTAVRNRNSQPKKPPPPPKRLSRSRTISSALQRASMAVINVVKLLPFKSPEKINNNKKRLLSKKLFKRSFWKRDRKTVVKKEEEEEKECDEIERWISSGVVGCEKYQPLDLSNDTTVTSNSTNSDGKSDSWSDITFASTTSFSENDAVERREKPPPVKDDNDDQVVVVEASKRVAVTAAQDSAQGPAVTENLWCNEEAQKEQFSPVSVMDFPDNDNEEGNLSPFTLRVNCLKGTKERLMKKLGRFESLTMLRLEPVNLEGLMSCTEINDQSPEFSIQSCATPSYIISSESDDDDDDNDNHEKGEEEEESQISSVERKATNLLNKVKLNTQTKTVYKFEAESLLLDFFREKIEEKEENRLLKAAQDWVDGHYDKLILGWEVKDKRQAYIRDMEEGGKWPKDTKLEKQEVAIEFGGEVLSHLIEEIVVECCSSF